MPVIVLICLYLYSLHMASFTSPSKPTQINRTNPHIRRPNLTAIRHRLPRQRTTASIPIPRTITVQPPPRLLPITLPIKPLRPTPLPNLQPLAPIHRKKRQRTRPTLPLQRRPMANVPRVRDTLKVVLVADDVAVEVVGGHEPHAVFVEGLADVGAVDALGAGFSGGFVDPGSPPVEDVEPFLGEGGVEEGEGEEGEG